MKSKDTRAAGLLAAARRCESLAEILLTSFGVVHPSYTDRDHAAIYIEVARWCKAQARAARRKA